MRQLVICAVLALAACGGSGDSGTNPGTGPLAIGIVSGDHQVVTAGHDSLPQPVVGKLVRKPDGSVAWIRQLPGRALDVLVPRAFAQGTVVTGSPVAGAVVCAVSTDSVHKLTPFVPCTNTDANGQATFFFTASTTAGVASAQIRGTLNSEPAVFDTATATVTADSASLQLLLVTDSLGVSGVTHNSPSNSQHVYVHHSTDSITVASLVKSIADKYGNVAQGAVIGWRLTQLSTQSLTATSNGSSTLDVSPFPSALPSTAPASPASTAAKIAGLASGYMELDFYVNGRYQSGDTVIIAVLP